MESLVLSANWLALPALLWLACVGMVAVLLMLGHGLLRMAQSSVWKLASRRYIGLGVAFDGWIWRALALVLIFVGSDLFVASALGIDKLLPALSLDITFGTLMAAALVSPWNTQKDIPA